MKFATCCLLLVPGFAANAVAQFRHFHPINHVIVIVQENRTVDNLLGSNAPSNQYYLPGLDFATSGQAYTVVDGVKKVFTVNAVSIPLASKLNSPGSIAADDYSPGHSHEPAWVSACDAPAITDPSTDCAMDGFNHVEVACDPGATGCPGPTYPTYAYVQYKDVAPYFQIASQYGYANYTFQTNQGPSFPAHQFIFGGTSQPGVGKEPNWFVAENMVGDGPDGCIAYPTSTVKQVDPATQAEITMYPCFTHNTMADLFAAHNPRITWTYYTPGQGSLWTAPDAISTICTNSNGVCTGKYWTKGAANGFIDTLPSDVLTDIDNCNLSQVSWVIPSGLESDHAGATDGSGPSWVASIVNDIGESACIDIVDGQRLTYGQDTAILITWDDWGGWYDHVVPPPLSFRAPLGASSYAYGFRVPLLVFSAYTPAGTVSNTMGLDFGSILRFIEETFDLGTISDDVFNPYADYYANGDLSEFFQFDLPPRKFEKIQAPLTRDIFFNPDRPIEAPDNE
jgi:phospholipase C